MNMYIDIIACVVHTDPGSRLPPPPSPPPHHVGTMIGYAFFVYRYRLRRKPVYMVVWGGVTFAFNIRTLPYGNTNNSKP